MACKACSGDILHVAHSTGGGCLTSIQLASTEKAVMVDFMHLIQAGSCIDRGSRPTFFWARSRSSTSCCSCSWTHVFSCSLCSSSARRCAICSSTSAFLHRQRQSLSQSLENEPAFVTCTGDLLAPSLQQSLQAYQAAFAAVLHGKRLAS